MKPKVLLGFDRGAIAKIWHNLDRYFESRLMNQRTIEGTWEDILRYASELTGQQVRLTVLSPKESQLQQPMTLDQTLQGRIGRVQFQPSDLSVRTKEAFADLLADKYQSWGHR